MSIDSERSSYYPPDTVIPVYILDRMFQYLTFKAAIKANHWKESQMPF